MEIKDKIRALRQKLGLSQEALAERCGFPQHNYVSRTESGGNQLSRQTTRRSYARGFGLSAEDFDRYLDTDMTADEAAARIRPEAVAEPAARKLSPFEVVSLRTHDLGALERALFAAMHDEHEPADFDVARDVVRACFRFFPTEIEPSVIARQLLAAATSLRADGLEVTIPSVLARAHPVDESVASATRPKVSLGGR